MKTTKVPVVIKRDKEIHLKDPGKHPNQRPKEDYTSCNILHPKKGLIHQIVFYRILTLCSIMASDKTKFILLLLLLLLLIIIIIIII